MAPSLAGIAMPQSRKKPGSAAKASGTGRGQYRQAGPGYSARALCASLMMNSRIRSPQIG